MADPAAAYAFSKLAEHLRMRADVQNIDLMVLAGFCRNCLSKWYHAGAWQHGIDISYDRACEYVYGVPYKEWKRLHQQPATEEQLRKMVETKAGHAQHEPQAYKATQPPPSAPRLLSDVCCNPVQSPTEQMPPMEFKPPTGPVAIRLGVLTVSDRAAAGVYDDLGGPEVVRSLEEFVASGVAKGCTLEVICRATVPDESAAIQRFLLEWTKRTAELRCNLVLTTGGTGLAPRDVTPEATLAVVDRPTPGISELLLRESLKIEPLAALSRAAAGLRHESLIVNLPGRPKAVRENLLILAPILPHALLQLANPP